MITVGKYLEISEVYNNAWDKADQDLKRITEGNINEMGLINEETRKSKDYINAKKRYDFVFKMVREFNKTVSNKIKRQASEVRRKSVLLSKKQ